MNDTTFDTTASSVYNNTSCNNATSHVVSSKWTSIDDQNTVCFALLNLFFSVNNHFLQSFPSYNTHKRQQNDLNSELLIESPALVQFEDSNQRKKRHKVDSSENAYFEDVNAKKVHLIHYHYIKFYFIYY